MTSLPCHFRSREVKWRHFLSRDGHLLRVSALRSSNVPKTWNIRLLQPLPGDLRWNAVTSGHVRSRDVISCHVTATSCGLQSCESSNVHKTRITGLLQPLQGDFRSNDVTSGSFAVTWRHILSCDDHLLRVTAMYEPNVPKTRLSGLLQSLPGDFRSNDVFRVTSGHVMPRHVISCHVTATSCELQPCRSSNVPKSRITGLLQPLPDDFRSDESLPGHFRSVRSRDIFSCHVMAASCELKLCKTQT